MTSSCQPSAGPTRVSIENYPSDEATLKVNTPRSLEACRMEGIDPEELLYMYECAAHY